MTRDELARIAVVGTSCSGKTTLARTLSERLQAPHVELDAHHWGPDWTENPPDVLSASVQRALSGGRWVCDGNFSRLRATILSRATALVWLNYTFPVVMARAVRRTVRRVALKERLYADNVETFRRSFLSRDSILLWVITSHRRRRRKYRELFASNEFPDLRLVELRTPAQTRAFLDGIAV
jgi:adenylate kinase family enzyme